MNWGISLITLILPMGGRGRGRGRGGDVGGFFLNCSISSKVDIMDENRNLISLVCIVL